MPTEVIMPKVDMDMASGKVVTWHVEIGTRVEKGAALFDIETDKAAMEVEAPATGFLHHAVAEGTDVPIGHPVAWIYQEGETVGDPPGGNPANAVPHAVASAPPTSVQPPQLIETAVDEDEDTIPEASIDKLRATPLARSLARKGGIELGSVRGSGHRGRIQGKDVRDQLEARPDSLASVGFINEPGSLGVSRSRGGTGVPLVLIHGFASDAMSWAPLEGQLKGKACIRIELPNHGKSPKRRIANFAALVAEVRQTFEGLGLEKAHLVGHSLGGAVALAIADTRYRLVESVNLIAPAGLGPQINGLALEGICRAKRAESLGPWLKSLVSDEKLITDSYVRLAMAARADPALRAAQEALAETMFPDGVQSFDITAALDRLEVPTRIFWGKNDKIIPWQNALRAPGRVALHLYEGVGHMPQIEIPAEIGATILAGL